MQTDGLFTHFTQRHRICDNFQLFEHIAQLAVAVRFIFSLRFILGTVLCKHFVLHITTVAVSCIYFICFFSNNNDWTGWQSTMLNQCEIQRNGMKNKPRSIGFTVKENVCFCACKRSRFSKPICKLSIQVFRSCERAYSDDKRIHILHWCAKANDQTD